MREKPKATPKKKRTDGNIEAISRNVLSVRFAEIKEGWEQWVLLSSDRHHDSIHSDREMELMHLEMVKERKALIVDAGDLFDAMQGKFDPRRTYKDLRPEYKVENYLDEIVADAARFYGPYADRFLVIGRGNHDQAILKNHGVDLISGLVHRLNSDYGGKIQAGFYGGWVMFRFEIHGTQKLTKNLKYFHGAGGGGPVTRGVIQTNRQAVYLPDADIVLNGHTHDAWHLPIARERVNLAGSVYQDMVHYVRTTSYKDEYQDGADGWHVETWKPPKPIGAAWLRFYYSPVQMGNRLRSNIGIEVIQALRQ